MVIALLTWLLLLHSVTCEPQACQLELQKEEEVYQSFLSLLQQGSFAVNFEVSVYHNESAEYLLSTGASDSFLPHRWVWASQTGAFLLKLPIDFPLLSFYIMSVPQLHIVVKEQPPGCSSSVSYSDFEHQLAQILIENATHRSGYNDKGQAVDGGGICRSAYTITHIIDNRKMIAHKCCTFNSTNRWVCNKSVSQNWEVVWFAPLCLIGWAFIIMIVLLIAELRKIKASGSKVKFESFEKLLKDQTIGKLSDKVKQISKRSESGRLISKSQPPGFLDAIGIKLRTQKKLSKTAQSFLGVFLGIMYYSYLGISCYFYWTQLDVIRKMENSHEITFNIFNHIGWAFADPSFFITKYAWFEAALTATMPIFLLLSSIRQANKIKVNDQNKGAVQSPADSTVPEQNEPSNGNKYITQGRYENTEANDEAKSSTPFSSMTNMRAFQIDVKPRDNHPNKSSEDLNNMDSESKIPKFEENEITNQADDMDNSFDDVSIRTEDLSTFQIKVPTRCDGCSCMDRYRQSKLAKRMYVISLVVVILYLAFVGGIHISYILYFVLKGVMLNFTTMPAWILPLGIVGFYSTIVFRPIFNLYSQIKEKMFELCEEEEAFQHLVQKTKYDHFLPRVLVEKFYIKNTTKELFNCFMKILTATGMLVVVFVVTYPTEAVKSDGSSGNLMTSLILILPFLAKDLKEMKIPDDQMKELEEKMKVHIQKWIDIQTKLQEKALQISNIFGIVSKSTTENKCTYTVSDDND